VALSKHRTELQKGKQEPWRGHGQPTAGSFGLWRRALHAGPGVRPPPACRQVVLETMCALLLGLGGFHDTNGTGAFRYGPDEFAPTNLRRIGCPMDSPRRFAFRAGRSREASESPSKKWAISRQIRVALPRDRWPSRQFSGPPPLTLPVTLTQSHSSFATTSSSRESPLSFYRVENQNHFDQQLGYQVQSMSSLLDPSVDFGQISLCVFGNSYPSG
jgi:hypothetical protein